MSEPAVDEPVGDNPYVIPPYEVTQVMLASEAAKDRVDWGQLLTNMPDAWKRTKGKHVVVAVLDTGVDRTHYERGDLKGQVLDARNFTSSDPSDYWDGKQDGHGTHVCGTVAGREDGAGVVGMAPECKLLVGRVMRNGQGAGKWIAAGIRWAVSKGAHVISLSLGSPMPDQDIAAAIEEAVAAGCIVLCAAGNTGRPDDVNYPARFKKPQGRVNLDNLAVAAADENGKPAKYSSQGPEVDFIAPGSNVTSTWLDGSYSTISGTSMATPHLAGGIALVLSANVANGAVPRLTHDELRALLRKSAVDVGAPGRDDWAGWGMPDWSKAVPEMVAPAPSPTDPSPGGIAIQIPGGLGEVHVPARLGDTIGYAAPTAAKDAEIRELAAQYATVMAELVTRAKASGVDKQATEALAEGILDVIKGDGDAADKQEGAATAT